MSSFGKKEKYFARILSDFPLLKSVIKKIYAFVNFYIHKKEYDHKTILKISEILSNKQNESFFGYYDKSPLGHDGKYIIFQETDGIVSHLNPDPGKPVNIMLFDIEKCLYKKIHETSAYNWQQGSRLMWLSDYECIFNDFNGSEYYSKIYNIENNSFTNIDFPVYDCYKDQFALSVNFSRLNITDIAYGYKNVSAITDEDSDGIFYVDLKNNIHKLIIDINNFSIPASNNKFKKVRHCFNHIMISPDGNNFIFIYRKYNKSGKRNDTLLHSDILGEKITVLADDGMVSHCCWYGNQNVISYMRDKTMDDRFYIIDTFSKKIRLLTDKISATGDGHPSVFNNLMVFDSYPDKSRMKKLLLYDLEKNELKEIAEFLEPLNYNGETRCDLHPRWSADGKKIFIDSVHKGKRSLYYLDL